MNNQNQRSILLANVLDHYDTCLYGLMVPILAPKFFPQFDEISQLILAYSLLATSIVAKPLGVLIFNHLAGKFGTLYGLSWSIIGVAASTAAMGLIPDYATVGLSAPYLLAGIRLIRGLCSAGETTLAKLYLLERQRPEAAITTSSYYHSTSILGIICASLAVLAVGENSNPDLWRLPFIVGALTGSIGIYWRYQVRLQKNNQPYIAVLKWRETISAVVLNRRAIFQTAILVGFSFVTYAFAFIIFTGFIPKISDISLHNMLSCNIWLLCFDLAAMLSIGYFTRNCDPSTIMYYATLTLGLVSMPLLHFCNGASLGYITFTRIIIIVLGIFHLCPLNVWIYRKFANNPNRYLLTGLGSALGISTIGKFAPSLSLLLWQKTGLSMAPGIYLSITALACTCILHKEVHVSVPSARHA